jgi:hypothetical protein
MATKVSEPEPVLFQVKESFVTDGIAAPYIKGEVVHADDPYLKLMPERFEVFVFPHPVKRRVAVTPTEIRAE